jgi:outer membrane protein assembly factor BamD (BamD/ComL family)
MYNMGLVYAHPQNPKRDRRKAIGSFQRVTAHYPESPWVGQAKIWMGVLSEAEETGQEVKRSKEIIEISKQEAERSRQELEKSRQEIEKTRQEIERTKQIIERSRQVDIEIEEKRRVRGR